MLQCGVERRAATPHFQKRRPLRKALDRLYLLSGALAALCLAAVGALMLAQALGREAGLLIRGADDIVAWLTAASAFLPLAHTFRHGEMVRVGLIVERLPARARRPAEIATLALALVVVGYIAYAAARFVYQSWKFGEVTLGLIQIPVWIPQASLVAGATVFFVAVLDDFVVLLRGGRPSYQAAADARRASEDLAEPL